MKIDEWKRRIPLDLNGVRLLGAALYLRACNRKDKASRAAESRRKAEESSDPINEFEWPHDLVDYERDKVVWEEERSELAFRLNCLNVTYGDYEKSRQLRGKDFQFRWDHLRDHGILVGFITDDQPNFAKHWDRETLISDRWGDALTEALGS